MSQPPPASTERSSSTSRKKARTASASFVKTIAWTPVIIARGARGGASLRGPPGSAPGDGRRVLVLGERRRLVGRALAVRFDLGVLAALEVLRVRRVGLLLG